MEIIRTVDSPKHKKQNQAGSGKYAPDKLVHALRISVVSDARVVAERARPEPDLHKENENETKKGRRKKQLRKKKSALHHVEA